MKQLSHIIVLFLLFLSQAVLSHGLEFRLTLSGKILLGLAYRFQIDSNTAVRVGSYLGVTGAPVGLHFGMVQDITPSKVWTPFFELGADMIFYKSDGKITRKIYPSSNVGLTYCPQTHLKHSVELWLGYLGGGVQPVGLRYVHYNSIN